MLNRKKVKKSAIQTLVGVNTRVHGDIEFDGGFHVADMSEGTSRPPGTKIPSSVSVNKDVWRGQSWRRMSW